MKNGLLALFVTCGLGLAACGSSAPNSKVRSYNATASVGDFIIFTIHADTLKIDYANLTTRESGSVDYTVNADGSYQIQTPDSRFVTAYELPGFLLVMQGRNMGKDGNQPALIVGIEKERITMNDIENLSFNSLQFRTTEGGIELGHGKIDSSGNITFTDYWPLGALSDQQVFRSNPQGAIVFSEDSTNGTIVGTTSKDSEKGVLFGTPNGNLIMDLPAGSQYLLRSTDSPNFDPSTVGTYKLILYQKSNVPVEGDGSGGNAEMLKGTATITAGQGGHGRISIVSDTSNNVLETTDLMPFSESDLYNPNDPTKGLNDPCNGLFIFKDGTGAVVFVNFVDQGLAVASFGPQDDGSTPTYKYVYGFGIKDN